MKTKPQFTWFRDTPRIGFFRYYFRDPCEFYFSDHSKDELFLLSLFLLFHSCFVRSKRHWRNSNTYLLHNIFPSYSKRKQQPQRYIYFCSKKLYIGPVILSIVNTRLSKTLHFHGASRRNWVLANLIFRASWYWGWPVIDCHPIQEE